MARELSPQDFEIDSTEGVPAHHLSSRECTAVLFQKPTCPWCQKAKPAWNQFAQKCVMDVAVFDVSKYPTAVERMKEGGFQLTSYPTFIFYRDGKPVISHDKEAERTVESFLTTASEVLKQGCKKMSC